MHARDGGDERRTAHNPAMTVEATRFPHLIRMGARAEPRRRYEDESWRFLSCVSLYAPDGLSRWDIPTPLGSLP